MIMMRSESGPWKSEGGLLEEARPLSEKPIPRRTLRGPLRYMGHKAWGFGKTFLWTLLFGLLVPFILGPILVRNSLEFDAPRFGRVSDESVPAAVREALAIPISAFEVEGFEHVVWMKMEGAVSGAGSYLLAMDRRAEKELAVAFYQPPPSDGAWAHQSIVLFVQTDYADGTRYETSNRIAPRIFELDGQLDSVSLPGSMDPAALLELHRHRLPPTHLKVPEAVLAAQELVIQANVEGRREFDAQVDRGYFAHTETGAYRPSWKGAVLMTWEQAWDLLTRGALGVRNLLPEELRRLERTQPVVG